MRNIHFSPHIPDVTPRTSAEAPTPTAPSPRTPSRVQTQPVSPRPENRGRNLISRSLTDLQSRLPSRTNTAPSAEGSPRERLARGLHGMPSPKKLFSSLQAKLSTTQVAVAAPSDGKPSTITSFAPETIFKKANAEELRISHLSHHNDPKGKLIGKFMGMAFKKVGADKQAVFSRHVESVQQGTPDLDKIKQMLLNDDVVMLEGNLGNVGADVWPYPKHFFEDTKAKVAIFAGGEYDEVKSGMQQLHKEIGDRLLTMEPAKHTEMNAKGVLTPDFARKMLAPPPPPPPRGAEASAPAPVPADDVPTTPVR